MTPGNSNDLSEMSMMDLFRMEAENHCATLTDDLLALEQKPGDGELLESLMRAAHSIKGAARIVAVDHAVQVAHAMEDVFVAAQEGKISLDRDTIDILLNGVDMLKDIAQTADDETEKWFNEHKPAIDGLTRTFTAIISGEKSATPSTTQSDSPTESTPPAIATQSVQAPLKKQDQTRHDDIDEKVMDRALRVSAEGMNRLMGLAGQIRIEARWLPTFAKNIVRLKQRHDELFRLFDNSRQQIKTDEREEFSENAFIGIRQKIDQCRTMLSKFLAELENHAQHSTDISHKLYQEVISNKMRPFSEGIRGFPRMVRDVSRELNKEVRLEIIGAETFVDRDILEKIEAPLNHLIRNAIDHGIEFPEERVQAGKPREGTIRLEARHSSGMLNIEVSDDGRGINLEKLRKTIVAKKMVSEEMARDLREHELLELLFLPNFSTKGTISKISGRGVGLDVVHSVVHEVRGVVRSTTKLGEGTRYEMQLPLTLSVLRALLVDIYNEPYAFPLVAIDHVIKIHKKELKEMEGRQYITLKDKRIGLVSARQVLKKPPEEPADDQILIVILSDRLNQYGLIVDKFFSISDLVVQALDPRINKLQNISAAAILEDGSPVLIIDVEDMVRSMDSLISGNRLERIDDLLGSETREAKRILVADDSITVREVERKMLTAKGYVVDVAVDGMDAWNALNSAKYNLVVTDIDMPRMNGIELVDMIKKDPNLNEIPIIIVSYKDREEDKNRGLEAGADYYLTKGSFQDETLVRAVEDLIGAPEF